MHSKQVNMHDLYTRSLTGLVLIIACSLLYLYTSITTMTALLIIVLSYILIIEYPSLYKPTCVTSYLALSLIIVGGGSLIYLNKAHHSVFALSFIVAMLADMGGYFFGKLFGKHHIAPTISPKKTWEGFIGSCIIATLGMYIYTSFFNTPLEQIDIIMRSFIIGCTSAIAGLLGDLCISQLKRNAGVKDTGTLLPGHGGLLDRMDSVLAISLLLFLL